MTTSNSVQAGLADCKQHDREPWRMISLFQKFIFWCKQERLGRKQRTGHMLCNNRDSISRQSSALHIRGTKQCRCLKHYRIKDWEMLIFNYSTASWLFCVQHSRRQLVHARGGSVLFPDHSEGWSLHVQHTAHPGEANTSYGVREDVSQDGRVRVGSGEVGVKLWAVPVCHLQESNHEAADWPNHHSAQQTPILFNVKHIVCELQMKGSSVGVQHRLIVDNVKISYRFHDWVLTWESINVTCLFYVDKCCVSVYLIQEIEYHVVWLRQEHLNVNPF